MFDERSFKGAAGMPLADGMTVYSSDGDKLGTVHGFNPRDGYLGVRKGWLFHRDVFVQVACIAYVQGGDVVLGLERAELEDPAFHAPPPRRDAPCPGGKPSRVRPLPALEHEVARVRGLLGRHHRPHHVE